MPGVNSIQVSSWKLELFNILHRRGIEIRNTFALATHHLGSVELMKPYACCNIRQIVLITGRGDLIVPVSTTGIAVPGILRQTVQGHETHTVGEFTVVCNRHPTLTSSNGFVCIE